MKPSEKWKKVRPEMIAEILEMLDRAYLLGYKKALEEPDEKRG